MICEWQNRKWVFSYLRFRNGERRIRRWRDSLQEFHQYSDISFACKTNICRLVELYCYIYVKKQFDYTKLTRETEKELGEKDCTFNEKEEKSSTHLCSHFTNLDSRHPYHITGPILVFQFKQKVWGYRTLFFCVLAECELVFIRNFFCTWKWGFFS